MTTKTRERTSAQTRRVRREADEQLAALPDWMLSLDLFDDLPSVVYEEATPEIRLESWWPETVVDTSC